MPPPFNPVLVFLVLFLEFGGCGFFRFWGWLTRVFVLAESRSELDVVSSFSEIVPDTVIFDDFEKYGVEFCLICFLIF